jgi:hypothetical protein
LRWEKKGLIYAPDGSQSWARHSALQPTPIQISDDTLRVYLGFRNDDGVSSVGFVDVLASNPSQVLRVSEKPALTSGEPGAFDESGVVPSAAVWDGDRILLSYAGYQLGQKVRFFVFGGLARSEDGEVFQRLRRTPVLDRCEEALFFRVAHSIRRESDAWRVWYGAGSEFRPGRAKSLPVYDIRYLDTENLLEMPDYGEVCIALQGDEHRVGRPYVTRRPYDGCYLMFYGTGTEELGYRLGYAESVDGRVWRRRDEEVGIDVSPSGWDSTMIAYPAVITVGARTYLFYNGNDYGRTGFGYAELVNW